MNYKAQLKDKGLKITWLAEKVGVSRTMMSQVVNGHKNLKPEKQFELERLLK